MYYLQSRYYDPAIGRFINADHYASTGQGFLGCNMFAYCGNNPVSRSDPFGNRPPTDYHNCGGGVIGYTDTGTGTPSYTSADAAAVGFSYSTYSSSSYVRLEYSTEIYYSSCSTTNAYHYTAPTIGKPHNASIDPSEVPKDGTFVAYAHTHPNSNSFSRADRDAAKQLSADAYVVGPNLIVQKYDYLNDMETNIAVILLRPLSSGERNQLLEYRSVWDNHFINGECPSGFDCKYMPWPNG